MPNPIITLHVDHGEDIKIELFSDIVPASSEYFLAAFKKGYYDGLSFHTCVKDEYIQFGYHDLNGYGVYASDLDNAHDGDIDENDNSMPKEELLKYEAGTLAVITSKYPYLAKMQLAILFTDKPILSGGYEVIFKPIGRVISGYDYAKSLSHTKVDNDFSPILPIVLESVSV